MLELGRCMFYQQFVISTWQTADSRAFSTIFWDTDLLLIGKSFLYVINVNPSSLMLHFSLSLHSPFNFRVHLDKQVCKIIRIVKVWNGCCEEWERDVSKGNQRLKYYLKGWAEVWCHEFLMASICKAVAAFGYFSSEGKRGESGMYLELCFACCFNQELDKEGSCVH